MLELLFALVLGFLAYAVVQGDRDLEASGRTAVARIAGVDECSPLERRCLSEVRLVFRTGSGQMVRTWTTEVDWQPPPQPGDRITVSYHPSRPGALVREQQLGADWWTPALAAGLALILAITGAVALLHTRRRAPAEPATPQPDSAMQDAGPDVVSRVPIRRITWFETLTADDIREMGIWDRRLWWSEPYLYVTSVLAFLSALVLVIWQPLPGPAWPYGLLALLAQLWPAMMNAEECAEQERMEYGPYALRAQIWLLLGGAVRQAVRAMRLRRAMRHHRHERVLT
ncbi:MAG TPA: DUF3592 domain-containing protein [Nocardioidaceae bacterium]|nr:DUF3592 domain-containing protein [Nocardioidaceae bacterium]